ncbi:MAG: internal scaffolding protein [Microviridae sp.]|nr:MAG: internal scaffolding protein [Microviridae sp.]
MSFSQKSHGRVQIDFTGDLGLTEQSHKDSCDIHNILKKSEKTGIMEHVSANKGTYGTMPTGDEFQTHMNIIASAETMFETVPSKLRNQFENDPAKFLDFISNDANKAKLDELGLDSSHLKAPEVPKPKVENATPEVTSQV